MTQTTLNIQLDSELKYDFARACEQQKQAVSVVLQELIKTYCENHSTSDDEQDDYDAEFYAKIDKAMQSPIANISEKELFALHSGY